MQLDFASAPLCRSAILLVHQLYYCNTCTEVPHYSSFICLFRTCNFKSQVDPGASTMEYVGQCPAKSGLWGYNFITIKIARCTKQHIYATVLPFPCKFRTLVPTPFLCVKFDFCDLHLFRAVDTTIVNPADLKSTFLHVRVLKTCQIRSVHRGIL